MQRRHTYLLFGFFYIVAPTLLAWIGYIIYAVDTDKHHQWEQTKNAIQAASVNASKTVYFDLPQLTPSITLGPQQTGTLKMDLALEVSQADMTRIVDYEPRILDRISFYMQDKDFDDTHHMTNLNSIRQGLEREIRRGAFPIPVIDVVIKEMALE